MANDEKDTREEEEKPDDSQPEGQEDREGKPVVSGDGKDPAPTLAAAIRPDTKRSGKPDRLARVFRQLGPPVQHAGKKRKGRKPKRDRRASKPKPSEDATKIGEEALAAIKRKERENEQAKLRMRRMRGRKATLAAPPAKTVSNGATSNAVLIGAAIVGIAAILWFGRHSILGAFGWEIGAPLPQEDPRPELARPANL